jgi:hypothetical protein
MASINKTTSEFSAKKAKLLTANVTESDKLNLVVLYQLWQIHIHRTCFDVISEQWSLFSFDAISSDILRMPLFYLFLCYQKKFKSV